MIFYFSGTGNTRWAAQFLSRKTEETIINMASDEARARKYILKEDERIGFCFPVHGWRPPKLVRDFIRNLHIQTCGNHYCYTLCTAGDTVGEAVRFLEDDLSAIGISLNGAFSLIMPESYVGLPFMDVDTPERENEKKEKAEKDLERFSEYILRRENHQEVFVGKWPKINSRIIGWLFVRFMITDKPFRVNAEKCVKCGKCVAACPVRNMFMNKGNIPEWKHNGSCTACFSCYHHCPVHAIEYGKRTKNKGRYFYKQR